MAGGARVGVSGQFGNDDAERIGKCLYLRAPHFAVGSSAVQQNEQPGILHLRANEVCSAYAFVATHIISELTSVSSPSKKSP
jgi:hypothetical protein